MWSLVCMLCSFWDRGERVEHAVPWWPLRPFKKPASSSSQSPGMAPRIATTCEPMCFQEWIWTWTWRCYHMWRSSMWSYVKEKSAPLLPGTRGNLWEVRTWLKGRGSTPSVCADNAWAMSRYLMTWLGQEIEVHLISLFVVMSLCCKGWRRMPIAMPTGQQERNLKPRMCIQRRQRRGLAWLGKGPGLLWSGCESMNELPSSGLQQLNLLGLEIRVAYASWCVSTWLSTWRS